jgi:hypothetical protein
MKDCFEYIKDIRSAEMEGALVARVSTKISGVDELMQILFVEMKFPGYFGFNWNALFDCLRDFHWVDGRRIILLHDVIPEISVHDLRTYFEVLRDSVMGWKAGEAHSLEVFFDESAKAYVESVLFG